MSTSQPKPTHVCFVAAEAYSILAGSDSQCSGGAEVQQVLLARELQKHGYSVSFIVRHATSLNPVTLDGIRVYSGPFNHSRLLGGSRWRYLPDTVALLTLMRRIAPDIYLLKVPLYLLFTLSLYRAFFGGRLVKLVAHDRDCQMHDAQWTRGLSSRLLKFLYRAALKGVDASVFQTTYQKEVGARELGMQGKVIKNIAHPLYTGTRHGRDIDALWVGTCIPRKHPEAFLDVAAAMPESRFTMIIAPGHNPAYNTAVADQARRLPNVSYEGLVPYHRVAEYFARARLLIHTSESEGFSNVCLQAWQAGVPVVSLSLDPDRIISQYALGLVSETTARMLKDVESLLKDDVLLAQYGANAVRYVCENHAPDLVVQQYIELFDDLLTPEKRSP
jgi:glycosyltransferase involved in cell wall biosynthesis